MRLLKNVAVAFGLCIASNVAQAAPGDCYLSVGVRTYLDGLCNIDVQSDGSFSIGIGNRSRSRHFAMVNLNPADGTAQGYWNGAEGASHAHWDLGHLVRRGGCWLNGGAKVCAWKPGTRPDSF